MLKRTILSSIFFLLGITALIAQEKPVISVDNITYDFKVIEEMGGLAHHSFMIKNTGNAPLVINRVTASCGCTRPTWPQHPIAPNETTEVKVAYDPRGRVGEFHKTINVYSNAQNNYLVLNIKGEVVAEPKTPPTVYSYNVGNLLLNENKVSFGTVSTSSILKEVIKYKNSGEQQVHITLENTPAYLSVSINKPLPAAGEEGEISLLLNAKGVNAKGRIYGVIPVKVSAEGKTNTKEIPFAANIIDDFSDVSPEFISNAAIIKVSTESINFGKLTEKGNPLSGGRASETITIANTGKSPLKIYSISSDNKAIKVSGKKDVKPNSKAKYKISLLGKEVTGKLETEVIIVCNDPQNPVRVIKVTAEK